MTNTSPATSAAPSVPSLSATSTAARVTTAAGLVSGVTLVADTVTIAVINGSFGMVDNALFLLGFVLMWVTFVGLAWCLSGTRRGAARLGVAVAAFLVTLLVVGGLSLVMDTLGRHTFSESHVGLHGEWSFFTTGLCLLAIAAWMRRRA